MVDVFAGISGFNTMRDAAKALKGMNDAVVRNEAVIDLQGKILTAQEEFSALLEEVRSLKAKLTQFEDWETVKQRYELKEIKEFYSAAVYSLKEGVQPSEPMHYLCPDCYQHRKKSILQNCRSGSASGLECNQCMFRVWLQGRPLHR